ncbi:MAG: T9SS type A sorting domain-containing protein [Chitinophagaceae bacterium]|nr:T9SS type A sorting domain-containing protein [Chitinophagaceae bacterium]
MMKRLLFTLLICVVCFCQWGYSQSISWAFNQSIYTADTSLSKYLYPGVYTLQQLDSAYSRFVFTSNEFYGSYKQIAHSNTIQPCAGNAFKLDFSLNSKSSSAYFYKIDTSSKSTAVFIIPGTGNNQSSQILSNTPPNYHNYYSGTFFGLPALAARHGDLYLYIKPNDDIRAIRNGMNKLNDLNVYPVLTNRGTSYTSNLFIECFAMIKYLKSKYDRVIVLGLSQGGTCSMITGIETEPAAVLSCSGYSTIWDTAFYASGTAGLIQDSLFQVYSSQNILDSMKANSSYYFYSWAQFDVNSLKHEFTQHTSQMKWGNPCNVQYHYGSYDHSIPHVMADSFMSRANRRPLVRIESLPGQCLADSMVVRLKFTGTPPFHFNLYRDSLSNSTYTINDTIYDLTLFQEGKYQIRNLIDQRNTPLCKSREFEYVKSSKPLFSFNFKSRDCLSHLDSIELHFTGIPPFNLQSSLPGIPSSYTTSLSHLTLGLPQGQYPVLSISDSSNCSSLLMDTLQVTHDTLMLEVGTSKYHCDSQKTAIPLQVQGIFPIQINYFENGLAKSDNVINLNHTLWFQNGNSIISTIVDSAGCNLVVNHAENFSYSPLQYSGYTRTFRCDSVDEEVIFSIQGNYPVRLYYRKNLQVDSVFIASPATKIYWGNGSYQLDSLYDQTRCHLALADSFQIAHDTLEVVVTSPVYHCDSLKSACHIGLEGHLPFLFQYTKDGISQQIQFNQFQNTIYLSNGQYVMQSVTDAMGCQRFLNASFSIQTDTLEAQWLSLNFICDSAKTAVNWSLEGNPPFTMAFLKNGIPDSVSGLQSMALYPVTNGQYQYQYVRDMTGCILPLTVAQVLNFKNLTAQVESPVYSCDSNKARVKIILSGNPPYQMNYIKDGQWFSSVFTQDTNALYWSNGLYSLVNITDATNCTILPAQAFLIDYSSLSLNVQSVNYSCDSNKAYTPLTLTGNPPFNLNYLKGGIPLQLTFYADTTLFWENGSYQFQQISDQTGCSEALSQTMNLAYNSINWNMNIPTYQCDSNKTKIEFVFDGNAPFTLFYKVNGVSTQETTWSDTLTKLLGNGNYLFESVKDATNCLKNINQYFTFSFQPLAYSIPTQYYDCDSNQYRLNFVFQGNGPWTLTYSNGSQSFLKTFNANTGNLFLPNGNWTILQLTDQTCTQILNLPIVVNYQPILAQITNQVFNCDSHKMAVTLNLAGNAPWKLNYTKLGIINQSGVIQIQQPTSTLFFAQGDYMLNSVVDNTSCSFSLNHFLSHNMDSLKATKTLQQFDCDSGKLHIRYQLTGNPPIILTYKEIQSGNTTQVISNNGTVDLYLSNSSFVVLQASDLYCTKVISDTITNTFRKFEVPFLDRNVLCDSGKNQLLLAFEGGQAPYQIAYSMNGGASQNWFSSQDTIRRLLINGQYQIQYVMDALGCMIPLNYLFEADYNRMTDTSYVWTYPCSGDSTRFLVDWYHAGGVQLNYAFNNVTDSLILSPGQNEFYLSNGPYIFHSIQDSAGCQLVLRDTFLLRNEPVNMNITSIEPHCQLRKHIVYFQNSGLAPWVLSFNQGNITHSKVLNDSSGFILLDPDFYRLNQIEDSNHCIQKLDSSLFLAPFAPSQPLLEIEKSELVIKDSGKLWYWYQDNNLIDSTVTGRLVLPGNGSIYARMIDLNGCEVISNTLTFSDVPAVSLFPNPASSSLTIRVSMPFDDYWSYSIRDAAGRALRNGISEKNSKEIDVSSLATGTYYLQIELSKNFDSHSEVIRFLKH